MKKIYLLVCLSFLLAPLSFPVHAEDRDRDDRDHHRSGAPEMPGVGLAAAAAVGIAGYLVLRRRHASQK